MSWWGDRQADDPRDPSETRAASTSGSTGKEVRLVLTSVREASPPRGRRDGALVIDAALLHGRGAGSATVTQINRPGRAIDIHTRALPLTLSVNRSFVRTQLRITPRDCALATLWTPSSQPFEITWEDERGEIHTDLGGDHDAAWEVAIIGFLNAACDVQ